MVSTKPLSRWRQNALLRELELHHLVDIGIDPFTMQPPTPTFTLRQATEADMESVQRIYGDHVAQGLASFEESPPFRSSDRPNDPRFQKILVGPEPKTIH